jgi:peptide deformylase
VVPITDEIRRLADDMLETMYDAPGIGLAAPQVGVGKRVLVMDCVKEEGAAPRPMVLLEPRDHMVVGGAQHLRGRVPVDPRAICRRHPPRRGRGRAGRGLTGAPCGAVRGPLGDLRAARDRPSERHALHRPPDRAQAPAHHPQDGQAQAREGAGVSVLPIVRWPDPRLSVPCAPCGRDRRPLRRLAADMLETMYAAPGRGLAGPQVGAMRRIFVMDVTWKEGAPEPMVFLDPEILWRSPETGIGGRGLPVDPRRRRRGRARGRDRARWRDLDGRRHAAASTASPRSASSTRSTISTGS